MHVSDSCTCLQDEALRHSYSLFVKKWPPLKKIRSEKWGMWRFRLPEACHRLYKHLQSKPSTHLFEEKHLPVGLHPSCLTVLIAFSCQMCIYSVLSTAGAYSPAPAALHAE